jgi:predicted esterase
MSDPDWYQLIGVDRNATLHDIRQKFRQRVLAEHPDKGGDPKKFQMLNKAYNILTDTEKRKRYDATGRTEVSAEEEFAASFGGGSMKGRDKEADREAVVNMDERMAKGPSPHEDGFAEWLRQRDQSEMVMTDKDFMKNAIFNAAEMATKITHTGPVQHVLGSPKTDAYGQAVGGMVQVKTAARAKKKTLDHDEILVRMLSVPVEESMIFADLTKSGVCLGSTGVGRVEQVGSRIEDFKQDDPVIVMPKPTKFASHRPIGTACTLLICQEEDIFRIPAEILEELTPEQICLTPTIVCAYSLLESFGAKLKAGDSVLLNASHLSSCGSAILQLCKLLKLKPLCLVNLPGAPKNLVKGEHGSKAAWSDQESRAVPPPAIRAQYERITEWLITMGAEETFPDAVALLRWRDRNQRLLPKLALDGIATRESAEQLMHCLRQGGDVESQVVVYGWGNQQPIEVSPVLLAAWGGSLSGFNIARWVHALSANAKKMLLIMENITKLVRANKFNLDTVLYKVGEDAISDAFSRAADASDNAQVVLIFPTLNEEIQNEQGGGNTEGKSALKQQQEVNAQKKKEDEERDKLKAEWLNLLFTDQSVAATSPEGPLPAVLEGGNQKSPSSLVVWVGDDPPAENRILKDLPQHLGNAAFLCASWSQHPAGEGLAEFNLSAIEVTDGSWYLRDRNTFENEDLDMLHDVELLGRSMIETIESRLQTYNLNWNNVVLLGFGFGAGLAAYAALLRVIPKQVAAILLFNPVVPFPALLAEKMAQQKRASQPLKLFTIWGAKDKSTPKAYQQQLGLAMRKAPEVNCTNDSIPDGDHSFDSKSFTVLTSLVPACLPR